ncbi:hypothetical protein BSKO_01580 [Bryopsis sp. KO-2023]|nr:hypothetical protein BSKO_01580 [Bryopsis sp. KO-2023]
MDEASYSSRSYGRKGTLRYHQLDEADDIARKFTVSRINSVVAGGALDGAPLTIKETSETLSKLKKMGGFESHDYDPVENDVEREANVHRDHKDYTRAEGWRWLISGLIGFTMGIIAFLVDWGIEILNDWKYDSTHSMIESTGQGFWKPYATFVGIAVFLSSIAGALVSYVEPLAAGSGIPELKTYLNGVHIKGLLQVKTFIAKLVGVMFSISSGLIAGKEGPFVHGGGIVGGGLGGMGSRTLSRLIGGKGASTVKSNRKFGGYFRNDADHRDFTAIGTAAGVATAFAAPIGGLLFTIEEGASFYSTSVMWRGFLSTCVGVLTLHTLVQFREDPGAIDSARLGTNRDFGLYSDEHALYGQKLYYYVWEMPIFVIIGAVCGLLGSLFVWLNVKVTSWRHRYIKVSSPAKRTLEVMFVAFVTGSLAFFMCYVSPCADVPEKGDIHYLEEDETETARFYSGGGELDNFPQMYCEDNKYSIYGQLFFSPLSQALRLVMHLGEPFPLDHPLYQFNSFLLIVFFFFVYGLMVWTYGVGAATGLFVPSLTVGAAGGRIVGRFVHLMLNAVASHPPRLSLQSYAIVGAAASLGGATRMTISICVLVMETTGSLQLIIPIMVAVMTAKAVGDAFTLGIYDTHIEIRGAPVLEEPGFQYEQKMVHDKLSVEELMSEELVCLPPVVQLSDLMYILRSTTHGGFPVSGNAVPGQLCEQPVDLDGLVTRIQLLRMCQNRIGFIKKSDLYGEDPNSTAVEDMIPATQKDRLDLLARLEQVPLKIRAKEDQEPILGSFTMDEMEQYYVDLRPFMQRQPFLIQSNASLTRAYRLFRTMGLRHLFVVSSRPRIVGLLTRKDVIKENAMLVLGEKANALDPDHRVDGLMRPSSILPFLPYPALSEKGTAVTLEGVSEPLLSNLNDSADPAPHSPYSKGIRISEEFERRSREFERRSHEMSWEADDSRLGEVGVGVGGDKDRTCDPESIPSNENGVDAPLVSLPTLPSLDDSPKGIWPREETGGGEPAEEEEKDG